MLVTACAPRGSKASCRLVTGQHEEEPGVDRLPGRGGQPRRPPHPRGRERRAGPGGEAGHALVAESRPRADRVAKVSVIPRGVAALGYTQQLPVEDRYLMTRAKLAERLDVLLGGRVAEELVFGDVSTGASDDLRRATDIARHMITRYGMSETLGLATFEEPRQALFLPVPSVQPKEYSERTAEAIDAEIQQMLNAAHERVRATLGAKRATLEALAKRLIEREVVDRAALVQLDRRDRGRDVRLAWTGLRAATRAREAGAGLR
jgi:cell division protease FtsH